VKISLGRCVSEAMVSKFNIISNLYSVKMLCVEPLGHSFGSWIICPIIYYGVTNN
jgi:hypothetical protein